MKLPRNFFEIWWKGIKVGDWNCTKRISMVGNFRKFSAKKLLTMFGYFVEISIEFYIKFIEIRVKFVEICKILRKIGKNIRILFKNCV